MGAWIETSKHILTMSKNNVAPHVGAWIETGCRYLGKVSNHVAPHVGAWIETFFYLYVSTKTRSRPTWARGLKQGHL